MQSSVRTPETHEGTLLDDVAYWLTIVAVYFLVGVLFFYSGNRRLQRWCRESGVRLQQRAARRPLLPAN